MRYRITIEIDTIGNAKRDTVNELAQSMKDRAVTTWCNPVYLTTEIVTEHQAISDDRAWSSDYD